MKKDWNPFLLKIITYSEQDVVATSNIFEGGDSSSSNDDFEGEIDWG